MKFFPSSPFCSRIALAAVVVLGGGAALMAVSRRRKAKAPADTEGSEE